MCDGHLDGNSLFSYVAKPKMLADDIGDSKRFFSKNSTILFRLLVLVLKFKIKIDLKFNSFFGFVLGPFFTYLLHLSTIKS